MKKGGTGGAKTVTGLHFEQKINLLTKITEVPGYEVKDNIILFDGKALGYSYPKHDLYKKFLAPQGIDYTDYVSKKYLPDEAVYVPSQNTMYIIEMKFQTTEGSVDEKLQTCDFKKKIYTKLFGKLKLNVEFIYVLNDWYNVPRLTDTFAYIKSVGCSYYFEELPLAALNFPLPLVSSKTPLPKDVEATAQGTL